MSFVGECQVDRPAGEVDQGECGLGGVEAVGAPGDESDLVVERLDAGVGDGELDRGEDPLAVLADRLGEAQERWEAAAGGARAEAPQQLGDVGFGESWGEDRAQCLLELVGAGDLAARALERLQRFGLLVGEVGRVLEQCPASLLELPGGVLVAE